MHLLDHDDVPCYYWSSYMHKTMNSDTPMVGERLTQDTLIQQSP